VAASLRELAEDVYAHLPPRPGSVRLETGSFVLKHRDTPHPVGGSALRVRLEDDAAAGVAEVRRWFAAQGRAEFTWHLASSTTPSDLKERLLALGAAPLEGFESSAAMALTDEPPRVDGVELRELTTLAEFELCEDIAAIAFGWGDGHRESAKAQLRAHWDETDRRVWGATGAFVDGELAAFANTAFLEDAVYLDGAATLPGARGRGLYRSLVHARWEQAVERGTPALIVQAGPMSEPILAQLGFRTVGAVEYLRDSSTLRS